MLQNKFVWISLFKKKIIQTLNNYLKYNFDCILLWGKAEHGGWRDVSSPDPAVPYLLPPIRVEKIKIIMEISIPYTILPRPLEWK